ncbi:MAG TPA: flagellar motor protein MotB [Planctomycetota bacterium]|nr:flagellar motor protein MotB [Planctomycetota bacterium]
MGRPLKLFVGSGPARDETEVRWLISYSDFMMQLVCLFLLLYASTALAPEMRRRTARAYRAARGLGEPPVREGAGRGVRPGETGRTLVGGSSAAEAPSGARWRVAERAGEWLASFDGPAFGRGSVVPSPELRRALVEIAGRVGPRGGLVTVTAWASAEEGGMAAALERAGAASEILVGEGGLDPRFLQSAGALGGAAEAGRLEVRARAR